MGRGTHLFVGRQNVSIALIEPGDIGVARPSAGFQLQVYDLLRAGLAGREQIPERHDQSAVFASR